VALSTTDAVDDIAGAEVAKEARMDPGFINDLEIPGLHYLVYPTIKYDIANTLMPGRGVLLISWRVQKLAE